MEQSAVEWLTGLLMNGYTIDNKIIQQALDMEKEQRSHANNGNYCAVCGGTEFWYDPELDSSIIEDDDDDEDYDDENYD